MKSKEHLIDALESVCKAQQQLSHAKNAARCEDDSTREFRIKEFPEYLLDRVAAMLNEEIYRIPDCDLTRK